MILAVLVYASLGDVEDPSEIGPAVLAAALFLAGSAVPAALATQFDAPGAASTAAVYGVLMLVAAAVAAEALRRRPSRGADRAA